MTRYLDQAKLNYEGGPNATASVVDRYGERIVLVRMQKDDGSQYVLAWIGAELAESPDEYESDELPNDWRPQWHKL